MTTVLLTFIIFIGVALLLGIGMWLGGKRECVRPGCGLKNAENSKGASCDVCGKDE